MFLSWSVNTHGSNYSALYFLVRDSIGQESFTCLSLHPLYFALASAVGCEPCR